MAANFFDSASAGGVEKAGDVGGRLRRAGDAGFRPPLAGLCGGVLVLLGVGVMLGWLLQLQPLVRISSSFAPMVFNTAFAFALAGCALLASHAGARRRARVTSILGGLIAALATLVLAEHALQLDFGIDWPPLHDWLRDGNPHPGRMSAVIAAGFLFAGVALVLAPRVRRPWMALVARILIAGVGAVGLLALSGYAVNAALLFPLYVFERVALHTSAGLVLLALGLLAHTRRFDWGRRRIEKETDRFALVSGIALVATGLAAGVATFAILQDRVEALVRDELQISLARRADVFQDLIELREVNARIAATRPAVIRNLRVIRAGGDDGSNVANVRAVVDSFVKQGFSAIAYTDVDGKVVASAGRFAQGAAISLALRTPDMAELLWDDGFVLRHRIPMRDVAGRVGDVMSEQPMPILTRMALTALDGSSTRDMGVCARRGEELLCFPQRLNPRVFSTPLINRDGDPLPMTRALRGETGTTIARDHRARQVVAAYGPAGDLGLGMVLKVDSAEVFAPIRERLQLALGLLVAVIVFGVLVLRAQVRPIANLLLGKLEERRAGLHRAQQVAKLAHVITGPGGLFESWSDTLPALIGVKPDQMPRSTRAWLDLVHPEDRTSFRAKAIEAGRTGNRVEFEYRLNRADGAVIHISQVSEPMNRAGDASDRRRWFGTLQDVTERKQAGDKIKEVLENLRKSEAELEQRVKQRTSELEAANHELEAFSYSVSHDLRAPLRHIDGYAQMLREDCAPALDDSGRRYLGVITESVKLMGQLIDDLLSFSRMGRAEMHQAQVSMDELVREVLLALAGEIGERGIEWHIEPLPAVRGDRAMLKQIWVNLLSNSVKYTRLRPLAKIGIGFNQADGEFYVKDNGAGFDMAYAGKLFGVFQRLHRADEFEGTGVGLASVQRIIVRHGGRIRAQGKVDEGAAFHFSLALHQEDHK